MTVHLTMAEADALRWAANEALDHELLPHWTIADAARAGLRKLIHAMGLVPYRAGRQVFGRRATRH
jgi:hypothetical protein